MEKTRKELLKEEIERYKELIRKTEQRKESASPYSIDAMNSFIEGYNKQIEMDEKEIEELTRKENVDYLSEIDKLKAVQWYLREDEGFLTTRAGFLVSDIVINENDEVVAIISPNAKVIDVDIHKLFDRMLNEKRRVKIRKLVALILESVRRIEELAEENEIASIRDTILEAF